MLLAILTFWSLYLPPVQRGMYVLKLHFQKINFIFSFRNTSFYDHYVVYLTPFRTGELSSGHVKHDKGDPRSVGRSPAIITNLITVNSKPGMYIEREQPKKKETRRILKVESRLIPAMDCFLSACYSFRQTTLPDLVERLETPCHVTHNNFLVLKDVICTSYSTAQLRQHHTTHARIASSRDRPASLGKSIHITGKTVFLFKYKYVYFHPYTV